MNRKQLLVIGLISLVPFIAFLAIPNLLGADSFLFLAFSCGQDNLPEVSIPFLSKVFFELMPCNLFAFKLLFFISLFASSVIVAKTGELYNKEHGWLAGVFVFISIAWIHSFIQVEDDILGFPFLFLANYLFLKVGVNKNNSLRVLAVVLVIFTGALIWKGALLYLVAYTFFSVFSLIILYVSLFYIGFGSMNGLLSNNEVVESLDGFLVMLLGSKTLGFGHGIGLLGMYVLSKRVWLCLPFLVATLLNFKWAIHLSPFLGLGLMFLVTDIDFLRKKRGIVFKEWWANRYFMEVFVVLAFVSTIALSVGLLFQVPYQSQMEAVDFAVGLSEGKIMDNDWSYGYWIIEAGGRTETFGGGWPNHTDSFNNGILLTENPEPYSGCILLREWKKGGFYQYDIKVYDCSANA